MNKSGQIIGEADEFVLNDKDGKNKLVINKNNFLLTSNKVTINSKSASGFFYIYLIWMIDNV